MVLSFNNKINRHWKVNEKVIYQYRIRFFPLVEYVACAVSYVIITIMPIFSELPSIIRFTWLTIVIDKRILARAYTIMSILFRTISAERWGLVSFAVLNKIFLRFSRRFHSGIRRSATLHFRIPVFIAHAAGQRTRKEIYGRGATPTSAAVVD